MQLNLEKLIGNVALASKTKPIRSIVLAGFGDEAVLSRVRDQLRVAFEASTTNTSIEVFIAPNMLASANSPLTIRDADAAILVICSGHTRRDELKRASEQLKASNRQPLGTIVVGARHPVPRFIRRILGVT